MGHPPGEPRPSRDRRAARLRRTYTNLGVGELVAAAAFGLLAASGELPVTRTADGARAFWSALMPLLIVLAQAGGYWLLARGWAGRSPMPASVARIYRIFRILNPVILLAGLIGVLLWLPSGLNAALVIGVWAFGVIEYVNYYVVRLAYPFRHWHSQVRSWRTPRLVKDLRHAATYGDPRA